MSPCSIYPRVRSRTSKARLGTRGANVKWIAADVTAWEPPETYDVWHDRAAFHFLIEPKDRAAYAARVLRAVGAGGHAIIGTFALDGPKNGAAGCPSPVTMPPRSARNTRSSFALIAERSISQPSNANGRDPALPIQPVSPLEMRRDVAELNFA